MKKALLGFSNTMAPGSRTVIHTAFRDHKTDEVAEDLIAEDEFFTPEEFLNADHRIRGRFDEFGQFHGEISIYGETISDHVIPWGGGRGARTNCGPFSIDFAAFEGESRHSTIPHEEHARLANKAEQLGGLYIYRNGIRVLPYGDTDYDWLDIEFRRTKSAYYYYFSHRKMFGAVEIDADTNPICGRRRGEKDSKRTRRIVNSGRYFRISFFRWRLISFERTVCTQRRSMSERMSSRRKRRRGDDGKNRFPREGGNFETSLNVFFDKLADNTPQEEALALTESVEMELRSACSIADGQLAARKVLELERRAQADIRELEARYRVSRPRIGLSKGTLRDWGVYNSEFASLQENVFRPARELIEDLIGEEARKARLSLDRRVRTEAALEDLGREARKTTGDSSRAVRDGGGQGRLGSTRRGRKVIENGRVGAADGIE